MALRCVIVDDSVRFLEAARDMLRADGIAVVGVAADATEAIERVGELRPDVTIIDVCLGDECGFRLTEMIAGPAAPVTSPVILVSAYAKNDFEGLVDDSPALAFLCKSELSGEAIRRIVRDRGPLAAGGETSAR